MILSLHIFIICMAKADKEEWGMGYSPLADLLSKPALFFINNNDNNNKNKNKCYILEVSLRPCVMSQC